MAHESQSMKEMRKKTNEKKKRNRAKDKVEREKEKKNTPTKLSKRNLQIAKNQCIVQLIKDFSPCRFKKR